MENMPKDILISLKERMFFTYGLLTILMLISIDLIADYDPRLNFIEFLRAITIEVVLLVLVVVMGQFLWGRLLKRGYRQVVTEKGLSEALSEIHQLREKQDDLNKALKERTRKVYKDWALSYSEKEVAELLLSSRSLKEIAMHRFTSEGTVKNQARSIYKKANVKNRTELMAAMLERQSFVN